MIHWAYTDISPMTTDQYQALYTQCAPIRRIQSDRYMRQEDKRRCVTADALLRFVLRQSGRAEYPNIVRSEYGKPMLADDPDFHFNLSHSGNYVAIAWGSAPVGIDVEMLRSSPSLDSIAQKHFTPQEQEYIRNDYRAFFQIWTKKEAYVKFLGTGLRQKLSDFCVINNPSVLFETLDLTNACLSLCSKTQPQSILDLQLSDIL